MLKHHFLNLCLLTTLPKVETSYINSSKISLLWVLWLEMSNYKGKFLISHTCVVWGKGMVKNIFWRFARNIKVLHHGKMLGISHCPGFLFKPLHTTEIFLKQLYSQSGSSLEGKKDAGMYEKREFGLVLSDQNSKFSHHRWIDPAATRTFTKLKKNW